MTGNVSSAARYAPALVDNARSSLDEHVDIVKVAASPTLLEMSKSNRDMLKSFTPSMPDWLANASQEQRIEVRSLVEQSVQAHTALSRAMAGVKAVHEFAEPLLKKKFGDVFSIDFEVNRDLRWLTNGTTHYSSLLQAALHNFESGEQYLNTECYIVDPRAEWKKAPFNAIRFVKLCRELDLGRKYQEHIKSELNWDDATAQRELSDAFINYQKAALKAASLIALRRGDIEPKHHHGIMATVNGNKSVRIDGKAVWYRGLSFMQMPLHSCIIFEIADPQSDTLWDKIWRTVDGESNGDFIAYIPDDPDHPVKHYKTIAELKTRLISQFVRDSAATASGAPTAYQQFFSRFTRYKDRAKFLSSFTEEVPTPAREARRGVHYIERRQKQAPDFLLQFTIFDPSGDPWQQQFDIWTTLHKDFRNRLLLDARSQAIPTEDADANARRALIVGLLELGLTALNLFSFAVPPLGVVMLGVSAVQLMYEVLEGLDDLSKGDTEAGWLHINDVLGNLALAAAAAPLAGIAHTEFTPIELANGQKRLWKPDLSAYRADVSLEGIEPNARGQYAISDRLYVRVDEQVVEKNFDHLTGTWRIRHPNNTAAYQPVLKENAGGWSHSLERPSRKIAVAVEQNTAPIVEGVVSPAHPSHSGKGISNATHERYAVEESLILGLSPSKGIYRSVEGQWCYIRNVDDAAAVAVYRISDSFNLNADLVDVNIVDPQSNRATEMRLWQVAPDQWQALSLKGGSRAKSLVTANDLLDWQRMTREASQATTLRMFAIDRGLFLPTLQRYVLTDGALTAEGLEFLQNANTPRLSVTAEHLSQWERLSARERHEWTREGFANRHSLDTAEFMSYVNQDGTLEPTAKGLLEGGAVHTSFNPLNPGPAFIRKRLPNGLWEPVIEAVGSGNTRHLPFDWGDLHQVSYSIEPTSIHQALSTPELSRLTISTELMDAYKARYSPDLATQIAAKEGGGRFIFTMERMKYSGAVEGEFNAIKILNVEAGELPDRSNAVFGYWAPQGGYVDIPVHPGWAEPDHVFTPGFGGCSLVVDQMEENLLRVRHVEGGKEAAQYNDLAVNEHGLGLSAAMEFPDYGLRLDENGNADSILTGFAFMKYDRTARVWKLHYQSSQGAASIIKYSTQKPGWFAPPKTLAQVYGRPKVVKIEAKPVVTIQRPANRHANEVARSTQVEM